MGQGTFFWDTLYITDDANAGQSLMIPMLEFHDTLEIRTYFSAKTFRLVPRSPEGWFIFRFLSLGPHGGGDSIELAKSLEVNFLLHWGCLALGSLLSRLTSPVLWASPKSTNLNIFFLRSYKKLAGLISPFLGNFINDIKI